MNGATVPTRSVRAGFTLIELLVSLVLATVLITGATALLRHSTAIARHQTARHRELQIASGLFDLIARDFRMALASDDPARVFRGGHISAGARGSLSFATAADSRFALLGRQERAVRVDYRVTRPARKGRIDSGLTLWRGERACTAEAPRGRPVAVCDHLAWCEVTYLDGSPEGRPRSRSSWLRPGQLPVALRVRLSFTDSARVHERLIWRP